jgi:hypothetical protein
LALSLLFSADELVITEEDLQEANRAIRDSKMIFQMILA